MISTTTSGNTLHDTYDKRDYDRVYGMVKKKSKSTYRRSILKKERDVQYPEDDLYDEPMHPLKYYDRRFNCKTNEELSD